ncbi:unnamed protein product [Rotaria socialis]
MGTIGIATAGPPIVLTQFHLSKRFTKQIHETVVEVVQNLCTRKGTGTYGGGGCNTTACISIPLAQSIVFLGTIVPS